MYKIYFKQAIELLKLNRFVSLITIIGTALAIMMIMVIVVSDSIKNISIEPEVNRDKTMYIKHVLKTNKKKNSQNSGKVQYDIYKNYLSEMKSAECISAVDDTWNSDKFLVKKDNSNERITAKTRMIDGNYWKIMHFTFIAGRPFTTEEFNSGISNAVISDTFSKKIFGNVDPIGKTIEIDFREYKVTGIVKNVSQAFTYAYGDVYIPFTSKEGYQSRSYNVLFLIDNKENRIKLEEEFRAAERRFNSTDNKWDLHLMGPYNHRTLLINHYSNVEPDEGTANRKMIFIFVILLLIPAVNLSSFSMSRIKRRSEEIGLRKAFGAKKYIILIQVIYENLITSLIGGIIGLGLSYLVVVWLKQWLLEVGADSSIPVSALVSLPVFMAVFVCCFLLNLLSAGLPAYRASTMNIVDSITKKNG